MFYGRGNQFAVERGIGEREMEIIIKKSKMFSEIFEELKGDTDLQELKVSVSIEVPINGAIFNNGIEGIKNKSASEEAEKEYYRKLKEAIGEIGIELVKDMENLN